MKNGENHRGVASRWYPETLAKRILAIAAVRDGIEFLHKDAFDVVPRFARSAAATFFVDPPYTAGGKSAGSRLYVHNHVDHAGLFAMLGKVSGSVLLTYDDASEVREFAARHAFFVREIAMKNTHHNRMCELALTNRPFDLGAQEAPETLLVAEKPPRYGSTRKPKGRPGKSSSGS